MADESGQEKSIEPTQKKIEDAREKGDFARSKEITTVAVFFVMLLFFLIGQRYLLDQLTGSVAFFLRFDQFLSLTPESIPDFFWLVLGRIFPILLPMFVLVMAAGLLAEFGQIGIRVRKEPFEPKWEKLDPIKGLKRIFSLRQFVEGLKSVIKLAIFIYVAYRTIRQAMPRIVVMSSSTPLEGLHLMTSVGLQLGFRTCVLLVFFAGFDYFYQRWQYLKNLRMTQQELKDELKEQQGDPVLKARIRSIQMEIARKRMMSAVPESDVVITNPTHYAVALQYDPQKTAMPIVVAKGRNFIAQRMREIALESGVPIVENPPIARALYKKVEVGHGIPTDLFRAVAQILASIWLLAEKRGRSWAKR